MFHIRVSLLFLFSVFIASEANNNRPQPALGIKCLPNQVSFFSSTYPHVKQLSVLSVSNV